MAQPLAERQDRFKRMFPPRVETLVKTLKLLGNCTNKSSYAWDQATVYDAWVQIGIIFCQTAELFGVKFELIIDGDEVQYVKPRKKRKA